jgi:hypothetical protein
MLAAFIFNIYHTKEKEFAREVEVKLESGEELVEK